MRHLTQEEIDFALDDSGESEEGYIAIEASIRELAQKKVGTSCGHSGNTAFAALGEVLRNDDTITVRGWFDTSDNTMCGMIHIQCPNDEIAEMMSEAAYEIGSGGSLRPEGKSLWEGFYEFEIE